MAINKSKNPDRVAIKRYDEATDSYIDWTGGIESSLSDPVFVSEVPVSDTPAYFENTNFLTGASPVTLDLNDELGRNATTTLVINDGEGNFTVEYSNDGSTFSTPITVKYPERLPLVGVSIHSIRITWVANSAYRVLGI